MPSLYRFEPEGGRTWNLIEKQSRGQKKSNQDEAIGLVLEGKLSALLLQGFFGQLCA
jgi:hypothetical protein